MHFLFKSKESVFILLMLAFDGDFAGAGAEAFFFLDFDLVLDLLLLFFEAEDLEVLLLNVTHDLPLHLCLSF